MGFIDFAKVSSSSVNDDITVVVILTVDECYDFVTRGNVISEFMLIRLTLFRFNKYAEFERKSIVNGILEAAHVAVYFMKNLFKAK